MVTEEAEKLPFWESLSEKEKEYVRQNSSVHTYEKGTDITGCGGFCLGMIYILSGQIRVLMISEEGRAITLYRLKKSDSCILSASCVLSQISFEVEMTATETTKLLVVNSGAYGRLMEQNLNVKCFSYQLATQRFSSVIWVLQQILFAKFDQRMAGFLLKACEESGTPEITMTKEAIAQEVNTAREVVSRMLKTFADDGLIEMKNKTIRILDKSGLQNIL